MAACAPSGAPDPYRVAVVQMDSGRCKEDNLRKISACVDEAADAGAKVVCLPEGAGQIASPVDREDFESLPSGPTAELLARKAREHGVYVHGGSFNERIEGDARACNTSVVVSPEGEVIARYQKMHTFDATLADGTCCKESAQVKPGSDIVVVQTPLGAWGLAVCYDVRFPEMFRMMALAGAQVVFVPANFTRSTGRDHWEVLLRARAVENGCYVIAANQCGEKPDFTAYGHSMAVDPWGTVLAEASGDAPEIVYAEVDLARVYEVRAQLPALANRRADVYGSFGTAEGLSPGLGS